MMLCVVKYVSMVKSVIVFSCGERLMVFSLIWVFVLLDTGRCLTNGIAVIGNSVKNQMTPLKPNAS